MLTKKIGAMAAILIVTLAVGVYAGMQLSNTLEASWTVVENQDKLYLWWDANTPGGNIEVGKYYYPAIGLENKGEAT